MAITKAGKEADTASGLASRSEIVELYKYNIYRREIEESDLFTHKQGRSTFYFKDGKVSNDVPEIQAFIDLSTPADMLLFRRRDSVSFQIIESGYFEMLGGGDAAVARAKALYVVRNGIEYDFPHRQIDRKVTDAQRSYGIGPQIYNMTPKELFTAFQGTSPESYYKRDLVTCRLSTIDEEPIDGGSEEHIAQGREDDSNSSASKVSSLVLAGDAITSPTPGHQEEISNVEKESKASPWDKDVGELRSVYKKRKSRDSHLHRQKLRPTPRLTVNTQMPVTKKRQPSPHQMRATNEAERRR